MRALSNMHVGLKFEVHAGADTAELTASFTMPDTGQKVTVTDAFKLPAAEAWLRDALAECIRARVSARAAVQP